MSSWSARGTGRMSGICGARALIMSRMISSGRLPRLLPPLADRGLLLAPPDASRPRGCCCQYDKFPLWLPLMPGSTGSTCLPATAALRGVFGSTACVHLYVMADMPSFEVWAAVGSHTSVMAYIC